MVLAGYTVIYGGEVIKGAILSSSVNRMTDRKELLLSVWWEYSFFNSRNLDVYIRKLRDKLKEDKSIEIKTIKGKGYLFIVKG